MNAHYLPLLARVDPTTVVLDPKLVSPSDWDMKAILEDLKGYVRLIRLNKERPLCGRLIAETDPPLAEGFAGGSR